MGSFNTACAITGAPITYGKEAYVFWLVASKNGHYKEKASGMLQGEFQGFACYPWDVFTIIGVPVRCVYEDYNQYIPLTSQNKSAEYTVSEIKKVYVENTPKEGYDVNPYHDYVGVTVNELDWEQLEEMEHSGALRCCINGRETYITRMAVHASIVDKVLEKTQVRGWGENALSVTFEDDVQASLAKAVDAIEWFKGKHNSFYNSLMKDSPEEVEEVAKLMFSHAVNKPDWYTLRTFPKDEEVVSNYVLGSWVVEELFWKWHRMLAPTLTSGQEYDFMEEAERLFEAGNEMVKLAAESTCDYIPVTVESRVALSLKVSDIMETARDCLEKKELEEFHQAFLQMFSDQRHNRLVVNGEKPFEKMLYTWDFLSYSMKGKELEIIFDKEWTNA